MDQAIFGMTGLSTQGKVEIENCWAGIIGLENILISGIYGCSALELGLIHSSLYIDLIQYTRPTRVLGQGQSRPHEDMVCGNITQYTGPYYRHNLPTFDRDIDALSNLFNISIPRSTGKMVHIGGLYTRLSFYPSYLQG